MFLEQTFLVPSAGNFNATLGFDWVAEFDLTFGASIPRSFLIDILDNNGNVISNIYTEDIPSNTVTSIINHFLLLLEMYLIAFKVKT